MAGRLSSGEPSYKRLTAVCYLQLSSGEPSYEKEIL